MPEVSSRNALVTGGSRGVGLETTKALLEEGYTVIALARNQTDELAVLQERYKERLSLLLADLKESPRLEALLADLCVQLGGIHVVVHAASPVPVKKSFHKDIYQDISEFMDVYLKSLITVAAITIPYMKTADYGRIVTLGTSFILGTPPQSMYPYIAAKEALWGLTKSFSVDYGRYGITANMVSPSMMITSLTQDIPPTVKHLEADANPLKRLVEPEEVAKTILFLCGEGATFINGTNIPITGGKQ
jgi:3-oxoacyl-[acyl-carrier protein] reductase